VTLNTGNVKTGSFNKSDVGPNALDSGSPPPLTAAPPSAPSIPLVTSPLWKTGGAIQATINGTAGADTLTGTSKNEYIDGKASHDTMAGGLGDDTFVIGSGYDKAVEKAGEGVDTVRLWIPTYTLAANVENLIIHNAAGARVTDNGLNNVFTASAGADVFTNNGGHDLVKGFKVGVDKIDLTGGATVARTAAGDMVLQHSDDSITLLGVSHQTAISSIVI
jgi:Ca2+-binding RTX toxin-like protein